MMVDIVRSGECSVPKMPPLEHVERSAREVAAQSLNLVYGYMAKRRLNGADAVISERQDELISPLTLAQQAVTVQDTPNNIVA